MIYETTMESPVGPLRLRASDKGLTGIYFSEHKAAPLAVEEADGESPILALAWAQLQAYFDGSLQQFDLPLDPSGTPFQLKVWETLRGIGFAETASYGQLAEAVGSPKGARAVGLANSLNPLSIVVPCHRVVGSSGKLTGYAGGLASKQWLLEHEQIGAMAAFL